MKAKEKLIVFVSLFLIAFIYFRLRVLLFFNGGGVGLLRSVTGLSIHHYHWGLIIILIASMMLIFWEVSFVSVGLMGFGLGSVYDSFISRLFSFGSNRALEISRYNQSFGLTLLLFGIIVFLGCVFSLWNEKI